MVCQSTTGFVMNHSKLIFEDHVEVGYNYRMTDIQAAVGIKQLEKLDWIVAERRKIAMRYHEAFKDIDCIQLPIEEEWIFQQLPVLQYLPER